MFNAFIYFNMKFLMKLRIDSQTYTYGLFPNGMPVILHKRELLYQINFSHDADLSPADRHTVVMPLGELHICKAFFPSSPQKKKEKANL